MRQMKSAGVQHASTCFALLGLPGSGTPREGASLSKGVQDLLGHCGIDRPQGG